MYDKANQLYHNKNYDSASQLYQQMLNDGYCSADLFYNAGNTYYRLNKIGWAIWCYEKALQLHENKNYSENLSLAKKRIKEPIDKVNDIFFIRWWEALYTFFSVNVWAILALAFFLVSFLLLFLTKLKSTIYISRSVPATLFFVSGFCLCMLLVSSYNQTYHYSGIIIEPKTLFSNTAKKDPMFINEGIEVKVIDTNGKGSILGAANYVVVKLPDGRIGSIDRRSFKKL